jgi:hypothetical protein
MGGGGGGGPEGHAAALARAQRRLQARQRRRWQQQHQVMEALESLGREGDFLQRYPFLQLPKCPDLGGGGGPGETPSACSPSGRHPQTPVGAGLDLGSCTPVTTTTPRRRRPSLGGEQWDGVSAGLGGTDSSVPQGAGGQDPAATRYFLLVAEPLDVSANEVAERAATFAQFAQRGSAGGKGKGGGKGGGKGRGRGGAAGTGGGARGSWSQPAAGFGGDHDCAAAAEASEADAADRAALAAPLLDPGIQARAHTVCARLPCDARGGILRGIQPGAHYRVRVETACGTHFSERGRVVGGGSLLRIAAVTTESTRARVDWVWEGGPTDVHHFMIFSAPGGRVSHVPGNARYTVLTDLAPRTQHTFTVVTDSGLASAPSAPVRTSEAVPPLRITQISATDCAVLVSWTWQSLEPARYFLIFATPGDHAVKVTGTKRSGTMSGLVSGVEYTFTVASDDGHTSDEIHAQAAYKAYADAAAALLYRVDGGGEQEESEEEGEGQFRGRRGSAFSEAFRSTYGAAPGSGSEALDRQCIQSDLARSAATAAASLVGACGLRVHIPGALGAAGEKGEGSSGGAAGVADAQKTLRQALAKGQMPRPPPPQQQQQQQQQQQTQQQQPVPVAVGASARQEPQQAAGDAGAPPHCAIALDAAPPGKAAPPQRNLMQRRPSATGGLAIDTGTTYQQSMAAGAAQPPASPAVLSVPPAWQDKTPLPATPRTPSRRDFDLSGGYEVGAGRRDPSAPRVSHPVVSMFAGPGGGGTRPRGRARLRGRRQ